MLSYRHAFHAGNHADVLKHVVEVQILQYLMKKPNPIWYVDSHAGCGCYDFAHTHAKKNAEYRGGIGRLWSENKLPQVLQEYVSLVRQFNEDGELRYYPGSAMLAAATTRAVDELHLFEIHPADFPVLEHNMETIGRRAHCYYRDGLQGIKALLPPPPRRGLVLLDPPYEEIKEYARVVEALKNGLQRFATGVYAVWYPLLQRLEARELPRELQALPVESWLRVELVVQTPASDGFGMHGSGMFVINPPWNLHDQLQSIMPSLVQFLGVDASARYVLEQKQKA